MIPRHIENSKWRKIKQNIKRHCLCNQYTQDGSKHCPAENSLHNHIDYSS